MNYVEIQVADEQASRPTPEQMLLWIDTALADYPQDAEIVVRIVDEQEISDLNAQYRHKSGPTNILSFPADLPVELELNLLGDLVVCASLLEREAQEQTKPLMDHWAHIIIHGVLHLLGYDHIDDAEAELMEAREIDILSKLGIDNPYRGEMNE